VVEGHLTTFDSEFDNVPRKYTWGWGICWLLFASTVLNYMDRQAVAVVGERITAEFQIRFEDLGWVVAAFGLPYALFQVPAGFIADRWDVRNTYAIAVAWWSLAAIAVAWSPTLGALMAFRAILGVGESFNWPCALKVTATVLPPRDRGLGNGIFNSGAAVGAVLTPLLIAPLTVWFGWRWAFALIGLLGLIWVVVWLTIVHGEARTLFRGQPQERRSSKPIPVATRLAFAGLMMVAVIGGVAGFLYQAPLTITMPAHGGTIVKWRVSEGSTVRRGDPIAELGDAPSPIVTATDDGRIEAILREVDQSVIGGDTLLRMRYKPLGLSAFWLAIAFLMVGLLVIAVLIPIDRLGSGWMNSLGEVVRLRRFWVLAIASISINVCWHFLVNWLPTYLKTDRGMAFTMGSMLSSLPFLAADVGNIGGGWASRWLTGRGMGPARARAIVLSICVVMIASGAWVGRVRDDAVVLALLAVMALGTAAFMANYFAYCQDVSSRHTGLVVGILGGLGNLFAAGFAPIAGRIKDTSGSFGPVFVAVGMLPFLGLAAILIGWGRDGLAEQPIAASSLDATDEM
jgi:MFS family permease